MVKMLIVNVVRGMHKQHLMESVQTSKDILC